QAGASVEAFEATHDGDERLLGGVEGVGVVAGDASTHGVDPRLLFTQQPIERASITVAGVFDQSVFGVGAHRPLKFASPIRTSKRSSSAGVSRVNHTRTCWPIVSSRPTTTRPVAASVTAAVGPSQSSKVRGTVSA